MDKIMWFVRRLIVSCLVYPVFGIEFLIKVMWGIFFFIFTPLFKYSLCKVHYRTYRDYGSKFKLVDNNYPITRILRDLWLEDK